MHEDSSLNGGWIRRGLEYGEDMRTGHENHLGKSKMSPFR